jgi:hypothetical protein
MKRDFRVESRLWQQWLVNRLQDRRHWQDGPHSMEAKDGTHHEGTI